MSRHRRAHGRDVDGILLLDKPGGMTSNFALQRVKQIFNANKAGHTGALDPLATGMLPICLGEATKFSQILLDSDKCYEVDACLGIRTDTSDADGQVVSRRPNHVTRERLLEALEAFRGEILQVPSMYSALKHNGRPLYEYARQGISLEREARPVTIHSIELLSYQGDTATLRISCSKGTYIRTIVDDLGEALGCGAHVTRLRRTAVASYDPAAMITLEDLNRILDESLESSDGHRDGIDHLLLPPDSAVSRFPELRLAGGQVSRIMSGQAVSLAVPGAPAGPVRLYDSTRGYFLGVGEVEGTLLKPRRLVRSAQVLAMLQPVGDPQDLPVPEEGVPEA